MLTMTGTDLILEANEEVYLTHFLIAEPPGTTISPTSKETKAIAIWILNEKPNPALFSRVLSLSLSLSAVIIHIVSLSMYFYLISFWRMWG
jgi:hypothetical protein